MEANQKPKPRKAIHPDTRVTAVFEDSRYGKLPFYIKAREEYARAAGQPKTEPRKDFS